MGCDMFVAAWSHLIPLRWVGRILHNGYNGYNMLILSQLRPLSPQFEQNKDKILTDAILVAKTTNISQWVTKYVYLSVCHDSSV